VSAVMLPPYTALAPFPKDSVGFESAMPRTLPPILLCVVLVRLGRVVCAGSASAGCTALQGHCVATQSPPGLLLCIPAIPGNLSDHERCVAGAALKGRSE
jgi:hypothetical protein